MQKKRIYKSYNLSNQQKKVSLLKSKKKKDITQILFNHKSSLEVLINAIKSFQNEYFAKEINIENAKQMLVSLKNCLSFMKSEKIKKMEYLKMKIENDKKLLQNNLFCDSTPSLTTNINNINLEKNSNYPFVMKRKELILINFQLENEISKTQYLIDQKYQQNLYMKSIPFFLDTNQEIFCNNNFDNLETTSEILSNITRSVRENFINVVREKMETELEIKETSLQINSLRDKLILDNLSKNKKYIDTEEIIYEETKENNKTLMTNQSKRNSFVSTHKIGIKNKSKIKKILSLDRIMKDNIKANSLFYIKNNELLNDAKNQINNYLNMNINVNINVNNNKFNKNPYSTSSFENEDKFKNSIDEQSFCEIELNDINKIIDTPLQTEENSKDE